MERAPEAAGERTCNTPLATLPEGSVPIEWAIELLHESGPMSIIESRITAEYPNAGFRLARAAPVVATPPASCCEPFGVSPTPIGVQTLPPSSPSVADLLAPSFSVDRPEGEPPPWG